MAYLPSLITGISQMRSLAGKDQNHVIDQGLLFDDRYRPGKVCGKSCTLSLLEITGGQNAMV